MAQGKTEEQAFAICNASLNKSVDTSQPFNLFIPITKVDVEKREVWGWATKEEPDAAGEIFDYASSKPLFEEWSNQAFKRSGGKSKGNIRAMHQLVAAGKLIDLQMNDANKGIFIGTKITKDDEWKQVQEGVYTGFSVGGSYERRWPDNQFVRYTAKPNEISLVDVPCVTGATFEMVKADGAIEVHEFKPGGAGAALPLNEDEPELEKVDEPLPASSEPVVVAQTVGSQPFEQVQLEQKTIELPATGALPDGKTLADAGAVAVELTSPPGIAKQQTTEPQPDQVVPDKKVKLIKERKIKVSKKQVIKMDVANLVEGAKNMVASLQEQAERGEVDQALLNQVAAALGTAVDYVANMESKIESETGEAAGQMSTSVTAASPEKAEGSPASPPSVPSSPSASSGSPSSPSPVEKANNSGPMPFAPPQNFDFYTFGNADEDLEMKVPAFTKAMMENNLREAETLAQHSGPTYDRLFNIACHKMLDNLGLNGWNMQNHGLAKAIAAPNMPGINLLPLARLMYPQYAGLSQRLPANAPKTGSNQSTWRANLGFGALNFAQFLRVAEAAIGPAMAENFLTFNAPYRDVTTNDVVSLKATAATRGYDDPLQVATIGSLSAAIQGRERSILGRNAAAIAAPGQPAAVLSATPGTIADDTYTVIVTALTYDGWLNGSVGGPAAIGETVGSPASAGLVIFGGGGVASIDVTFACVPGAVAYNVFVAGVVTTGGLYQYIGTTTIPTFNIGALNPAGAVVPLADTTVNANGYEGLISWAELAPIYGNAIPNKMGVTQGITDNAGAALTVAGSGIAEFDAILTNMWTTWNIVPTLIVCSPQSISHYTAQIMTLPQPQFRINLNNAGDQSRLIGGAMVTTYAAKFGAWADGNQRLIDMMAHPYMPDGTYLFLVESVPYPMSRESRGIALETLLPFTYFPLPPVAGGVATISYPFAITHSETVQCFHPSAQTALVGVNVA